MVPSATNVVVSEAASAKVTVPALPVTVVAVVAFPVKAPMKVVAVKASVEA